MKLRFFVLIFLPIISYSQVNPVIDSLENVVASNPHDTVKVLTQSELCWEYRIIDQKKALENGHAAVSLARKIDYKFGLGKSLNDLSIIYIDKGSLDTASTLLEEAKEIRQELNDPSGVAAIHNKLGIIYEHLAKLEDAMINHMAALEYYESIDNKTNAGFCLNNIGNVHFKLKNYPKSEEVHSRALAIRVEIDDKYGIAGSHSNLANLKMFMGDTLDAIYHYDEAIKVYRANDFENDLAVILNNLGTLYVNSDLNKAEELVSEALEIRLRLNDARGICSSTIIMGEIYTDTRKYSKAFSFLHEGLRLSIESGFENKEKGAYEKLAKYHTKTGNADSVHYYYSMFYAIEKAQYETNLGEQVNELQTIYETEKKDRENERLAREKAEETAKRKTADLKVSTRNNIIIIVVALAILILLGALLLIQRNKRIADQEKHEALQFEKDRGLKAVFKAQEDERSRISKDLHDGIGQQLSGIKLAWSSLINEIENPETKQKLTELSIILDKSTDEVRDISHKMMPKSLSEFGISKAIEGMISDSFKLSKVAYEFDDLNVNDKRFGSEIELTVFRISQEAINNCIKHAEASSLSYQMYTQGSNLQVLIEDNGKGMNLNLENSGQGILNMKSRISTVNGKINFESSSKGTAIAFNIPIK